MTLLTTIYVLPVSITDPFYGFMNGIRIFPNEVYPQHCLFEFLKHETRMLSPLSRPSVALMLPTDVRKKVVFAFLPLLLIKKKICPSYLFS